MNDKIKQIADHYGLELQLIKATEELAEFSCECSRLVLDVKQKKPLKRYTEMIEEMADVLVMIEQIKFLLNIRDTTIENVMNIKIDRTISHIEIEVNL